MVVTMCDLEDGGSVIFFADARVAQLLTRMLIPWRRGRRLARDQGLWRCCGLVARLHDAGVKVALVYG